MRLNHLPSDEERQRQRRQPSVFDTLQVAMPQLLALKQALRGSEIRDQRDVAIVLQFREQLNEVLEHLPRCT
jgi:hypothetical protein